MILARSLVVLYLPSKGGNVAMSLIREIVQQALTSGYLTVEAENQLRQLLLTKYDWEDFKAFITLQQEAMEGRVKQESRELLQSRRLSCGSLNKEVAIAS
jgi:hypothetical protein